MSRLTNWQQPAGGDPTPQPEERALTVSAISPGVPALLVGGLVVAGLGLLAWHYLWPDFQRYMKIRNM